LGTIDGNVIGRGRNYWKLSDDLTMFDLTRKEIMPVTSPKTIQMVGTRQKAIIEPSRSAFVIVDMQNFFLHPDLKPNAERGRAAVPNVLKSVDVFRENGVKILWVNWGLDDDDLVSMPPPLLDNFSSDHTMATSFGAELGSLEIDGHSIDMGRKLYRKTWNAQPWGSLFSTFQRGLEQGTDLLFHKGEQRHLLT